MKCSFCNSEFTEEESVKSCGHCALFSGCRLVKCPSCGYEMPQTPEIVKRFRKWRTRLSARKPSDTAAKESTGEGLLSDLRTGSRAEVIDIRTSNPRERGKLLALGITPGTIVALVQRVPSFVIRVGYTQLALDRETAATIVIVRLRENPERPKGRRLEQVRDIADTDG
jgi:ferrous iron transport protein A